MSHGDQMHNVQVVVGSADCRWLQVNGLLLVQRGRRQDQRHLGKDIFSASLGCKYAKKKSLSF